MTINDNVAADIGGAIFNDNGPITVVDSTLDNNQAQYGDGGAISNNAGNLTLTRSTVSNNRSFTDGGGISNVRGDVLIRDSLVTGNTSAADGGGIASVAGSVTLTNSTVHDNSANLSGGGIQTDTAIVRLVNSTVTDNSASLAGGGIGTPMGLLAEDVDAQIFIHNTIVAGNISPSGADFNVPRDPATNLQVLNSLIGNNANTSLTASETPDANGNLIGTPSTPLDPQLEALANNGGLTLTQAPMNTSPVIDRGDNALAVDFGADGAAWRRR